MKFGSTSVTFTSHCSNRLQPLDVGVVGPFKGKLRVAQRDWLTANPGKVIKIHDLTSLINSAYQVSFTEKNVTSVFVKSDVCPFSALVYRDEDFESSSVTLWDKKILPNQ
jgi:hypothetical protein